MTLPFQRVILDLCGGTGAWSHPYAEAGYDVRVIDPLRDTGDVRLLPFQGRRIHGILCAPPCTVFSYARNRYPAEEDEILESLSVFDACFRIVSVCKPSWWALENPLNRVRKYLGPPRLAFRQWEYGGEADKPTGIWGDFAIPFKNKKPRCKPSTYKTSRQNADPKDAITPAGFAKAFFEANP